MKSRIPSAKDGNCTPVRSVTGATDARRLSPVFDKTLIRPPGRRTVTARKSSTTKLDLYKEHPEEYLAPKEPTLVKVGPAVYLVVEGKGLPGGPQFQSAIGAVFGAAYTLKFFHKAQGHDYKVAALEALWGDRATKGNFQMQDLAKTPWRLVLRVPEFVTKGDLRAALSRRTSKGKLGSPDVTLQRIREGTCVQVLHVGPYAEEGETIDVMLRWAHSRGYSVVGPHHEIYLSDPRRVAPPRLKTILRLGVKRASARL